MKVVILAGGFGTRISEESHRMPKPMIRIGEHPILWHIMKMYSQFGFRDFIVCLGYKGEMIKEYFANYYLSQSEVTFDFAEKGQRTIHSNSAEPWKVTLVDTGLHTMTGGRIHRIRHHIDSTFMLTYGDGVSDVDITSLMAFHRSHGKLVTVTAVRPMGRFGILDLEEGGFVRGFREKPRESGEWINGGFFVMEPAFLEYLENDNSVLERDPLEKAAANGQLMAFFHDGFWQPMDTLREKNMLEALWESGKAPWKNWE